MIKLQGKNTSQMVLLLTYINRNIQKRTQKRTQKHTQKHIKQHKKYEQTITLIFTTMQRKT